MRMVMGFDSASWLLMVARGFVWGLVVIVG